MAKVYKLNYFLDFVSNSDELYRLEIYRNIDSLINIIPIQLTGGESPVFFDAPDKENVLEAIKGSSLRLSFLADLESPLTDLYTEDEIGYLVKFYKDSQLKWRGFIVPDGAEYSFVDSIWEASFDCVDGLGLLKNLAFWDAKNKVNFSGKMSIKDILIKCLLRTNIPECSTFIAVNIFYTGLSTDSTVDPLANIMIDVARFYKTDSSEPMNCYEVMDSILTEFRACVRQLNGDWYISKYNELWESPVPLYHKYTDQGFKLTDISVNLFKNLGSDINNFQIHHSGANQRILIEKAYKALTFNYKYGVIPSLNNNINFESWTNGVPDGYTKFSSINIEKATDGMKVIGSFDEANSVGRSVTVQEGDMLVWNLKVRKGANNTVNYKAKFTATMNNGQWRLQYTNGAYAWVQNGNQIDYIAGYNHDISKVLIINMPPAPISGDILFEVFATEIVQGFLTPIIWQEFSVQSADTGNQVKKGEFHTLTQPGNFSFVPDNTIVYNGDNVSQILVGTIYKADGVSNTTTWFRKGKTESLPLITIAMADTLRMFQKQRKKFTGSYFGYIDYLSVIQISGIPGLFIPTGMQFDFASNQGSITLRELLGAEVEGMTYSYADDLGTAIKPVIK